MAYLGRGLNSGNYLKLDDISSGFNGSATTFNLTSGGSAHYPGSAFSILVSLGGVIQEPESAYQINQNQIIFASAPNSTDDFFCISLGEPLSIGVPGNGTVDGAQLKSQVNGSFNVNTSGIITATTFSGTFSGGVGGGNVNAGIGTFTQIHVGSAVTANASGINVTGVGTFSGVKIGGPAGIVTATSPSGIVTYYGDGSKLSNIITGITIQEEGSALSTQATTLNFIGANLTAAGSGSTKTITVTAGAGSTFGANNIGIHTSKIVGVNTNTIAGTASSEGAIQTHGNIAITDGALLIDNNIDTSISVPSGKNGLLIGTVTVGAGATIDVATDSVLVVV
jgi:hypothetical protein